MANKKRFFFFKRCLELSISGFYCDKRIFRNNFEYKESQPESGCSEWMFGFFSIHRDEMWIVPFTIPHKWQTYSSHQSYLLAVNFPPLRCLHCEERRKSSSSGTTRSAMMFAINVFWLLHWNAVLCECQIHRRIHKTFHCWIFLWRNFPKHKKRNFSLFVWWNHLLHHENHKN